MSRAIPFLLFVLLVAGPLLLRTDEAPRAAGGRRLVILTPHNEQIRFEFGRAFHRWHERVHGEPASIVWLVPGGTVEIRRMLEAEHRRAHESGREPGGSADLIFGGGTREHALLREGIVVDGRREPITAPVALEPGLLDEVYGDGWLAGTRLFDADGYWFGTALSGFGIVFNRDAVARLGLPDPTTWADLTHPAYAGRLALVNPLQSGSIATAFTSILEDEGWTRGWAILRRLAANARGFSGSSLKPPADVAAADAAAGLSIDFYGRFQVQSVTDAGAPGRMGFVAPDGSPIDPDPVSLLRGAPDPILARRFIEFTISEEGQALWQFRRDDAGEPPGPARFELRRLPIRSGFARRHAARLIDPIDPYVTARPPRHPYAGLRDFVGPLFAAMAIDAHGDLRRAWRRLVDHPAWPHDARGLVMAEDVRDPGLRDLLRRFDAMPVIAGPEGARFDLDDAAALEPVRQGWLRGGWRDAGLWHPELGGRDALRRAATGAFRANYRAVVSGGFRPTRARRTVSRRR